MVACGCCFVVLLCMERWLWWRSCPRLVVVSPPPTNPTTTPTPRPKTTSGGGSSSKPKPNVVTFNILMDHYSGLGQWEQCRRTLQERMRAVRIIFAFVCVSWAGIVLHTPSIHASHPPTRNPKPPKNNYKTNNKTTGPCPAGRADVQPPARRARARGEGGRVRGHLSGDAGDRQPPPRWVHRRGDAGAVRQGKREGKGKGGLVCGIVVFGGWICACICVCVHITCMSG